MSVGFKIFLSMSFSGGLLILALLLAKPLLKDRVSRQWQYYIWLAVLLRLLLPFGPETTLMRWAYQSAGQTIAASFPQQRPAPDSPGDALIPAAGAERSSGTGDTPPAVHPLQDAAAVLMNHAQLIWLAAALGLLIRKITVYQGFLRYVRAGCVPVSDMELLDRLSAAAERAGVKRPVELCVNPLVSSPLLIGFFRPCIVLPSADIPEKEFPYIVFHELTHYKRGELFYKWLTQITVCLHWFNPLAYLMGREIARACEFSCDEAVLTKMGGSPQGYGQTLLDAMAAVGRYKETLGSVPLSENKQLLKERLSAIMNFRKKSTAVRLLTGALTLCVVSCAVFVGVYPAAAAAPTAGRPQAAADVPPAQGNTGGRYAWMAEKYYEAGSLPLFEFAFSQLEESAQKKWLEKIYQDGNAALFSVAVRGLGENTPLLVHLAKELYTGGNMAFFSIVTDNLDEPALELLLDQALEDGNWAFQSILFDKLNRNEEFDKLEEAREKEWEEAQAAEYGAAGVTVDGKDYYYQGQLVNVFLDIRSNGSFYTLNMNPRGTVHIQVLRGEKNEITGVSYLTEAEVTELLGDMADPEDAEEIPVSLKTVAAGESVFLGEYTLSEGDKIGYDITAETGAGMQVCFVRDQRQDTVYWSVHNLRQPGEPLRCTADFTVAPPAEPGTYRLFLRAVDGVLGNVTGSAYWISRAD